MVDVIFWIGKDNSVIPKSTSVTKRKLNSDLDEAVCNVNLKPIPQIKEGCTLHNNLRRIKQLGYVNYGIVLDANVSEFSL